mgnify:CR=1 FL=1|tara:strand:+ start:3816 stop:4712 length:897 start_codon:yes stop_codon:yes gene_type:complete
MKRAAEITTLRTCEKKGRLEESNPHALDSRLGFEEAGHVYYWDGGDIKDIGGTSSTTFIKSFFTPFNPQHCIRAITRGRKYLTDPSYKYYKKTNQEILDMWAKNRDEAADAGTRFHLDVELSYNGILVENNTREWEQFKMFEKSRDKSMLPYRTEWMIYDTELRLAGSLDMVFKNADGTYSIYDWKRSKAIKTKDSKKGGFPIEHLPDCNFTHYSLQLNLYKYILEKNYGVRISTMVLVVCHPVQNGFKKIVCPDLQEEISDMLDLRRLSLFKHSYITLGVLGLSPDEAREIDWSSVP